MKGNSKQDFFIQIILHLCTAFAFALILYFVIPKNSGTSVFSHNLTAFWNAAQTLHVLPSWQPSLFRDQTGPFYFGIPPLIPLLLLTLQKLLAVIHKEVLAPLILQLLFFLSSTLLIFKAIPERNFFSRMPLFFFVISTQIIPAEHLPLTLKIALLFAACLCTVFKTFPVLTSLFTAGLILSAGPLAFIFILYFLAYEFLTTNSIKRSALAAGPLFVGTCLSAFYWAPFFQEYSYFLKLTKLNPISWNALTYVLVFLSVPLWKEAPRFLKEEKFLINFQTAALSMVVFCFLSLSTGLQNFNENSSNDIKVSAIEKQSSETSLSIPEIKSGVMDISCEWLSDIKYSCSSFVVKAGEIFFHIPKYPRWNVLIDGKKNSYLEKISLKPGNHSITWTLKPSVARLIGNGVSLLAAILLLLYSIPNIFLRKRYV